ncbi:MAG: hypothetical protein QOK20_3380 [Acidimicrobiaceae bacterium]|nr:hypothetical protein [Acidimicrobiaceae bacterium]MDQ1378950.1 hypothetical protein [Acidimicrobiaceae bacterium]MDQ1401448.1 hypothetical protein [Acidimicrobiaceae bacterium]
MRLTIGAMESQEDPADPAGPPDPAAGPFTYLLMLDPGSPVSREAAEAARALITARLERDDPRMFYAELKRQVNRIFDGVQVSAELKPIVEERVAWVASLLSAMSVVTEMLVHGSTGLTRAVADATAEEPDEKDAYLALMATPERLIELTFQLAEEKGWTI